ncbi:MAG: hypothetical protein R3229_06655 [Alphaproteobacteria bacterium]|nr:hypothetical protein [Alphaproteobacteria bacterium]
MSLLRTLLRPDHDEHPERAEAARAANLIQVGEFQLIQLAYFQWFGEDMPEAVGHRMFHSYMVDNRVPHWLRHYARGIIARDVAGTLDDRDPAYHRYDPAFLKPAHTGLVRFGFAASVVLICVIGGLWVSHELAGKSTSFLPPYFSEEELRQQR